MGSRGELIWETSGSSRDSIRAQRGRTQLTGSFNTTGFTPWPSRIKIFGEQWINQWCGVSQGVTKVK